MTGRFNHKRTVFWRPAHYLWLVIVITLAGAQRILAAYPQIAENIFARRIFRWISTPIGAAVSWLPFSLTEWVVVIGIPLAVLLLVIWLIRLIRLRDKGHKALILYRTVAWLSTTAFVLFMFLHGFNYARQPVAETFNLPVKARSVDMLSEMTIDLIKQANELRVQCEEDESGNFRLRYGIEGTLKSIWNAYDRASEDYPLLAGMPVRPKSVYLSQAWSYTGIAGMYMPLWVESNINVAVPEHDIPGTALHEIAHVRGFAREDEAGFLAFLTGQYSDNPDIVYSSTLDAAVRSLNALAGADAERYQTAAGLLSDAVRRDLSATNAFWKQFEGPIRETSTKVNNAYLQANLQTDGVRSYGRMLDLVLAWYDKEQSE
ncbi:MAG: DUF3810 domain-containing protein [Clostridiaceae bacterium]|nr:DUF3810 domain-containing protein [Clostridiaceae bacterium]